MFCGLRTSADSWKVKRSGAWAKGKEGRGGRRYLPYVFTEQGVSMLSSVLNSERAIQVNIAMMRVFVRLREMMATHKELAFKLIELEERLLFPLPWRPSSAVALLRQRPLSPLNAFHSRWV